MNTTPVLLQYGPAPTPPPRTRETVGKTLTIIASIVGPPAAAVVGFIGAVVYSDCFLSCSGHPDHVAGTLLIALAVVLLLSGPVLAATLVRKWRWFLGALAAPFVEVALLWVNAAADRLVS